jgi:hypothetical protein
MSDSVLFSPISDVPVSGSVRYHWSWISDWVPTYADEAAENKQGAGKAAEGK